MTAVLNNDHLVREILSRLDIRDLGAAMCVDRLWHSIAKEQNLWSQIAERTPSSLVGPASRSLYNTVGPFRYLELVVTHKQEKTLLRTPCRELVDSSAWTRFVRDNKWTARLHIAYTLDLTIPLMENDDAAYVLVSFAECLEDSFHDLDAAQSLLLQALPLADEPVWIMHHLALLSEKQQDYDQAEQWFERAHSTDSTFVNNTCNYAVFMEERRLDYDRAEALYTEALQQNSPPTTRLDVYYALVDFYTFKRRNLDQAEALLAQAFRFLKQQSLESMAGLDVKVAIQYCEFLVYIRHNFTAARAIYGALVDRCDHEESSEPQVARFLCIGLLSYAIAIVFATGARSMALKILAKARAMPATASDPVTQRYLLTADCVVQHALLCRALESQRDIQSLGPLMGLLHYLDGRTANAIQLWSTCINSLVNVNSPDYAFPGYCTGVVLHLGNNFAVAQQAITKALTVDVHFVQFQNLKFILNEVAQASSMPSTRRQRALQFLEVVSAFFLSQGGG
ncbi:hypothetical protein AeNC1_002201 [Aphanomyces euteiches]|nr:hypothetical protein AeNC1_002201 [Aphanomyces euteiches]